MEDYIIKIEFNMKGNLEETFVMELGYIILRMVIDMKVNLNMVVLTE